MSLREWIANRSTQRELDTEKRAYEYAKRTIESKEGTLESLNALVEIANDTGKFDSFDRGILRYLNETTNDAEMRMT